MNMKKDMKKVSRIIPIKHNGPMHETGRHVLLLFNRRDEQSRANADRQQLALQLQETKA